MNYQYVKPVTQSTRSLSTESYFPDLLREIHEVDKELREAEEQSEDEEKREMKWVMSSQECSVTCGGGMHKFIIITEFALSSRKRLYSTEPVLLDLATSFPGPCSEVLFVGGGGGGKIT